MNQRTDQPGLGHRATRHPDEAALVTREAEVLRAARHPGVVELIRVEDHDGLPALVTTPVGAASLGDGPPIRFEEVGGILAAVASTLADLHGLGVVHGAVAPEHVLLTPEGRPVLCGFGHGGRIGQAPIAPPALPPGFADPARGPAEPLDPSTDVFGLGALMQWLVQGCRAEQAGRAALRLRALAARATAGDADRRPTAHELASAIADAVPGSRLPTAADGAGPATAPARGRSGRGRAGPSSHRRTAAAAVALGLGAVLVLAGVRLVRPTDRPAARDRAEVIEPEPLPPEPSLPSTVEVDPPATGQQSCPAVTAPLAADTDGDGCPEGLRYADGVLESTTPALEGSAGPARWQVGRPGDQVATGDWACAGAATLALLRPATGEVFVFDGWASPDRDRDAGLAGRVEGGFALRAADLDRDHCPDLVVDRRAGPPATVTLRSGP